MVNKNLLLDPINWILSDTNGEKAISIASFIPEVLAKIRKHSSQGLEYYVRLRLHFEDGQSAEYTMSLVEIENADWFQKDNRCLLNPNYRKAKEYIANSIRRCLTNAPTEEQYHLDQLGLNHVENKIVFVAGNRVITRSCDNASVSNIKADVLPFKLDIEANLSAKDAFDGMKELIGLSPEIGRILVAHVISGIMRTAFKEAGMTPCAVLVIVGKTGMLKSHYVPHLVQLYNRSDEIRAVTRFNSTKRFIEDILYDYAECTAVIDDLHTAGASSIKKINEATAEELIRRISDDTGRGHKEGNAQIQKKFRGNAVFIGEYTIGKESTVPRALVANLTVPPNSGILDEYQRHQPLLVSTFYYFFIKWYVEHFDDIRDLIDKELTKFRKTPASGVHLRLNDTQFYLGISYKFFLEFCMNSGFITVEESHAQYLNFGRQLTSLIQAQQARVNPSGGMKGKLNYLKLIRKLYNSDTFRLADSVEQFDQDKHDGLIYYECLCLRGERLDKRIRKEIRGFSHNDVINYLLEHDALKLVAKKHTIQISHLKGLRFYAIWLDLLD